MHNALLEAERLGFETMQCFTHNQQQWRCPSLSAAAVAQWETERRRLKIKKSASHASYLINLACADEMIWRKSLELFTEELRRCVAIHIPCLVFHPGSHENERAGIARIAHTIDLAHEAVPTKEVFTCLEVTAGQGNCIGWRLEHLAEIIEGVKEPRRMGVCLDTAHLFAAGYDFRGRRYPAFRRELSRVIGLSRVKVMHLNDSKKPLGSRVDRHEHIGRGTIGLAGFRPFVQDDAFARIPKVIETPKGRDERGRDWDEVNVEKLRRLALKRET